MDLLVEHGADVKATYRSGATALHLAADLDDGDIVELLLKHGADINARDGSGATALDEAAEKVYRDTAALLAARGRWCTYDFDFD